MSFNLEKLLLDVFQLIPEDKVVVLVDYPLNKTSDSVIWSERRLFAEEWQKAFTELSKRIGFFVYPLGKYIATGVDSGELPTEVQIGNQLMRFDDIICNSTLLLAMTKYSATGPLSFFLKENPKLRVASMPDVIKDMENTALGANYHKVAQVCNKLALLVNDSMGATVIFSSGHKCFFDFRNRKALEDNGFLPPDKPGYRLINLPAGEAWIVPYEGEISGVDSKTKGELPVMYGDELIVYKIEKNHIVEVLGDGKKVDEMKRFFVEDLARSNIAEFGLGCNDKAMIRGLDIEDEKAGFHWAYGRSDHLGGVIGVKDFVRPSNSLHVDIIYSPNSLVTVEGIYIHYKDGTKKRIWKDGWYVI